VSLKVKLTALISLLVLVLVLAASGVYVFTFVRQTISNVQQISNYVRDETYARMRVVLGETRIPPYIDLRDDSEVRAYLQVRLSQDAGLRSLLQSEVSNFPTIDYVAVTTTKGVVLAHNFPSQIGQTLAPATPLSQLVDAGLIHQLQLIYGPPQVYQVVLPLEIDQKPFCSVQIGVSTALLAGQELTPRLTYGLEMAALVIILGTLTAGILSFRLLRPLATISQSVDRLARGEFSEPVKLKREDEWGALSSKLNLLGEQMRGEKAAYLALRENLDQLFANLVDGLMLFDHEDRLVLATASVSRFLEIQSDRLVHKPAAEVFAGAGPLNQLLNRAFNERLSLVGQPVELPDNPETPRVAVTTHFVSDQGRQVASLVTLRDAGTRDQLQDQIGITTKLAALGRLTSGVAHEVKNPLNAMILQVEILKSRLKDQGGAVKPQLEILSAEIRRLDRVVKTFLDFTRPLEINRSEVLLNDLVNEVFALADPQARRNNVRLVLEQNGSLPALSADRDLLKQALLNLVLNGCQAMPHGGELRVQPRARPGNLDLDIVDQGVGIPEEAQQKIFTLFYTTKPGGSGIGLAMAYRIIQLHEGSIYFLSEVNRGTTFHISLPAA
jgi:signal transduction histidine kinase/HAMP domain-containing protein